MTTNIEPLYYYNRQRVISYTNTITEIIDDISTKYDMPPEHVSISIVCAVIPLFSSLAIYFSCCNEIINKGQYGVYSNDLYKTLLDRRVLNNRRGQIIVSREVLYAIGINFKPNIQRIGIFRHCVQFMYNQCGNRGSYTNAYNSYLLEYYVDKSKFKDAITISLEEETDLLLVSHSLRNLLDLESQSTNIKYLHKLYLLVENKRLNGRKDLEDMLSRYSRINLFIED